MPSITRSTLRGTAMSSGLEVKRQSQIYLFNLFFLASIKIENDNTAAELHNLNRAFICVVAFFFRWTACLRFDCLCYVKLIVCNNWRTIILLLKRGKTIASGMSMPWVLGAVLSMGDRDTMLLTLMRFLKIIKECPVTKKYKA